MITTQAAELRDALKALGLRDRTVRRGSSLEWRDFGVRTEGNGRTGFGNASAYLQTREAQTTVVLNAEALAEQGFSVTILTDDGVFRHVSITTEYNPDRQVTVYDFAIERAAREELLARIAEVDSLSERHAT